jgi:hypothetical protein
VIIYKSELEVEVIVPFVENNPSSSLDFDIFFDLLDGDTIEVIFF